MAKKSKKYVEALTKVDRTRLYDATEALALAISETKVNASLASYILVLSTLLNASTYFLLFLAIL